MSTPARTSPASSTLTPDHLVGIVGKLERESVDLKRQLAWFQRQIFGQKGEKRHVEPDGGHGVPGMGVDAVPDTPQYEVSGEKVTHRLAQRPGSYVVLKYVRPVIKRRDTQVLSCPSAPVGVIEGSRADVSFIAGDEICFLYYPSRSGQHGRAALGLFATNPLRSDLHEIDSRRSCQ